MRKVLAAIATVGFFAVAAYAGEVAGTVQGVDEVTRIIMLDDGTSYIAGEAVDLTTVDVGATVKITYDDTTMQATAVETGL